MKKVKTLAVFLIGIVACLGIAFAGCNTQSVNTDAFGETVNDIYWLVTYNTDTKEIISISSLTIASTAKEDTSSEVYKFVTTNCDKNISVYHYAKYVGTPIGNNKFLVSECYVYDFSYGIDKNYAETIKQRFPDAKIEQSSTTIIDMETGEEKKLYAYSVTIPDYSTNPVEMELVFTQLPR